MAGLLTLRKATEITEALTTLLAPVCERIEVVGSVRRGAPICKDLELLVIPQPLPERPARKTLFGAEPAPVAVGSALDAHVERLVSGDGILRRSEPAVMGPRYKRLRWGDVCQVDLFICLPPASWGALMAIRTGPADFSALLVQMQSHGGAMPAGLRQQDGALHNRGGVIDTPTEREWFEALGLPWWPPAERSHMRLLRELARRERMQHARTQS